MSTERFPIFRLASAKGRVRFYNTANHSVVKDEASARAAYLGETGHEATQADAFAFDELSGTTELGAFAHYGLG